MEQLELNDGQLAGVSILADGPGGFAVFNMCGKDRFASHTTGHATGFAVCNSCVGRNDFPHTTGHATVLWIWSSGGDTFGADIVLCFVNLARSTLVLWHIGNRLRVFLNLLQRCIIQYYCMECIKYDVLYNIIAWNVFPSYKMKS